MPYKYREFSADPRYNYSELQRIPSITQDYVIDLTGLVVLGDMASRPKTTTMPLTRLF